MSADHLASAQAVHTLDSMFRGITDLISSLAQFLPPEVLVPLLGVALLVAFPFWLRSVRVRQIKGKLRTAARAHSEQERNDAVNEAFKLASGKARLLVSLTEQAIRNGQPHVWRRGLAELEATGKAELDLAALRRRVQAPPKTVRDPLEAIVRVERLRDSGLLVAAREVLDEALRMHPEDDELRALAAEGWYASPDVPPGPASPALTPRSP